MNEKLNIQDLSAWLVSENGLSKEEADKFVKEFFLLIEDALEKEKYVKIKGLGVFKLIEVEPRESVNINTKERFEIPGYTKVSFMPDPALRDIINKPFSHFETVVLNENTVFDDKEEIKLSYAEEEKEDKNKPEDELADSVGMAVQSGENSERKNEDKSLILEAKEEAKVADVIPEEQLGYVDVEEHKSKFKLLYIILTGLVLLLLGGIFFFVSRYRMAYDRMENPVIDTLGGIDSLQEDSLKVKETSGSQVMAEDTIQFISSQTPLEGHAGE